MNVILFGATGMVGQGVLRECLLDPDVKSVLAVGRNPSGQQHTKLRDLVVADRRLSPDGITTSEQVGKAMLVMARRGAPSPFVEMADINALR